MPLKLQNADRDEQSDERMPRLLWFLGLHLSIGLAIGAAAASLILLSNVSGLKTLIQNSDNPVLAIFLLYAMNALTFGSMSMGYGVMSLPMGEPCDMREPDHEPRQPEH